MSENEWKESIWKDISRLYAIQQIYHSFLDHFFDDTFLKSIDSRSPNILIIIRKSLLSDYHITLRRILSTGKGENSLPNLYKKVIKEPTVKKCLSLEKCPSMEKYLPNSFEKWKKVKKYINKNIAHSDSNVQESVESQPSWQDLESIICDIKSDFDKITLKIEESTYSFDSDDTKRLADNLFKKMATTKK